MSILSLLGEDDGGPLVYVERHPVGDYRHLAPAYSYSHAWERDLEKPACLPERAEGFSIADEPRRCWPSPGPEQMRLLDA